MPANPSSSTEGRAPPVIHVELDIFSGRPNPVWALDADIAGALTALLAAAPATAAPAPVIPALGYRGFVYRSDQATGRVYRGAIIVGDGTLADPAGGIERLLLARLPPEWDAIRPIVEQALVERD